MLKWMRLKNLALVDSADMEFGPGFNVITGAAGAATGAAETAPRMTDPRRLNRNN